MIKATKILSILTAFAFSFVYSSGCIKTMIDELTVNAASITSTGDVNDDREVDILDPIYSKSGIIENGKLSTESSDVNSDGVFNSKDVYEIEDYLTGCNAEIYGI